MLEYCLKAFQRECSIVLGVFQGSSALSVFEFLVGIFAVEYVAEATPITATD